MSLKCTLFSALCFLHPCNEIVRIEVTIFVPLFPPVVWEESDVCMHAVYMQTVNLIALLGCWVHEAEKGMHAHDVHRRRLITSLYLGAIWYHRVDVKVEVYRQGNCTLVYPVLCVERGY